MNKKLNILTPTGPRFAVPSFVTDDRSPPKSKEYAMSKKQPGLPRNRAFVIQLHAAANVDKGEVQGRIEHVASAESTHFQSVEELVAFMVQVLSEQYTNC